MQETNLLLIDDEPCTLLAFKKLLQNADTQVDTAESLEEASDRINQTVYQVVVSDIRLSGTCGLEGLEILRLAKSRNPETVVILVTAHGNSEIRNQAMVLGAAEYFEKPVLAEQIRSAIAIRGGKQ